MSTSSAALPNPADVAIAAQIWDEKYRLYDDTGVPLDVDRDATFNRVARSVAAAEMPELRAQWEQAYVKLLCSHSFVPGGRILSGAGASRQVTLFNCFVMDTVEDSMEGIFNSVRDSALTMQRGGGIGVDFSTLRPAGARVAGIGAEASGPVSFMQVWDAMCATIMSAGARRGAMMATLRCDHPDIETFVDAKQTAGTLTNFNISVLVTDAFMRAVAADAPWELRWQGTVWRTVAARALWQRIMRAAYSAAEPGIIFIDRVNAQNPLAYCERIQATNPCGEQPLPPNGACLLGAMNLTRFVRDPFTLAACLDEVALAEAVAVAVRFLDAVIDVSAFPLPAQAAEAQAKRRIGLGLTGLANALTMVGARYGSAQSTSLAAQWAATVQHAAYRASIALAREKGAFPALDKPAHLATNAAARLPNDIRRAIGAYGLRNGTLTTIAPTGTTSLFAGNVSSGVEPVFALAYDRVIRRTDGTRAIARVEDYGVLAWRAHTGLDERAPVEQTDLPDAFVTAQDLSPSDHLAVQAALQPHVDSAISKTINCPADLAYADFADIYLRADALGLKGCTAFRPNPVTGSILSVIETPPHTAELGHRDHAQQASAGTALPDECPTCGSGVVRIEGCATCHHCGWQACGSPQQSETQRGERRLGLETPGHADGRAAS